MFTCRVLLFDRALASFRPAVPEQPVKLMVRDGALLVGRLPRLPLAEVDRVKAIGGFLLLQMRPPVSAPLHLASPEGDTSAVRPRSCWRWPSRATDETSSSPWSSRRRRTLPFS